MELALHPLASLAQGTVLVPACSTGDLVLDILATYEARGLDGPSSVYGVELSEEKFAVLKTRLQTVLGPRFSPDEFEVWFSAHFFLGNFVTGHESILPCPVDCDLHPDFLLPNNIDVILGTAPRRTDVYKLFVSRALELAPTVLMFIGADWRFSNSHSDWRRATLGRLVSLVESEAGCLAKYGPDISSTFMLNGEETRGLDGDAMRVGNGILAKAYRAWTGKLTDLQTPDGAYPLYLSYRCVRSKVAKKINGVEFLHQSLTKPDPHVLHLSFPSAKARNAYAQYSSTKLAAYLQHLTGTDLICTVLPIPPLDKTARYKYADDQFLYRQLNLSKSEIAEIEQYRLYYTREQQTYYEAETVPYREDAICSRPRRSCGQCGAVRAHRRSCPILMSNGKQVLFSEAELAATRRRA